MDVLTTKSRFAKYAAIAVRCALIVAMLTVAAPVANAQFPVAQDGRLFDANTNVGGSAYNYSQPVSPLIGGNPFATGNVGRGLSLRTISPVVDPTTFRAGLGSDSLSNFRRDSIATGYAGDPGGGLTAGAFFDPARTAPSGAYLQGYYDFAPATPDWSMNDQWTGTGAQPGVGAFSQYGSPPPMQPNFSDYLSRRATQIDNALDSSLSSALFGAQPLRLPRPYDNAGVLPQNLSYIPQSSADAWGVETAEQTAAKGVGPLDMRILPQTPMDDATPIDVLMRENATRLLTERTVGIVPPDEPFAANAPRGPLDVNAGQNLPEPPGVGPRLGGDLFTDMQMALELSRNPQAEWFTEMHSAVGRGSSGDATPTGTMGRQLQAAEAAESFMTRLFESPIDTFVGEDPSAVNLEMGKAETAMDMGRFYEAVRRYEHARMIDPANPLPLLGKGHALLAAGEYVSAAVNILAGLERFPSLANFHVDLAPLIGGGETVDIRRADLIKQLDRNEDPLLRFLLGYLEMHTGMPSSGIAHLEKAAAEAPPGSMIRKYPDMVRREVYFSPNLSPSRNDDAARENAETTHTEDDGAEGERE